MRRLQLNMLSGQVAASAGRKYPLPVSARRDAVATDTLGVPAGGSICAQTGRSHSRASATQYISGNGMIMLKYSWGPELSMTPTSPLDQS